ncbi:hypothetical protein NL676_009057 [Syzygium grande]|nr:hypothetical protein NL676_009057 [Syzygium grande]
MLDALTTPKTQNSGNFLLHTSRHTTTSDGSGPSSPRPPPGIAIARRLANIDGGGGAACLDRNSFILTLKRPPTPPMDEEGKVRKSKRLAVTRLFMRFIGLPEMTMVPRAAMVARGRVHLPQVQTSSATATASRSAFSIAERLLDPTRVHHGPQVEELGAGSRGPPLLASTSVRLGIARQITVCGVKSLGLGIVGEVPTPATAAKDEEGNHQEDEGRESDGDGDGGTDGFDCRERESG